MLSVTPLNVKFLFSIRHKTAYSEYIEVVVLNFHGVVGTIIKFCDLFSTVVRTMSGGSSRYFTVSEALQAVLDEMKSDDDRDDELWGDEVSFFACEREHS